MELPSRNVSDLQFMQVFRFFVGSIVPRNLLLTGFLLFLAGSFLSTGCDKNQLSPFDSGNTAPIVRDLHITPDSIYIDNLTPTNGEYAVSVIVNVGAADSDGVFDLAEVSADVIRPDGSSTLTGIVLHDDGLAPDTVAGDGKFSGSAEFKLTRAQAGRYLVKVSATDRVGAMSNALMNGLKLARRNSVPVLSNLDAPDSIIRPQTGSLLFSMTIAASDSDGLSDISQVYFKSLNSSDPTAKFFLYDDGGTILHNGVLSGDQLAGDGTYSIIVQLPSSASAGERLFAFQCQDTFGDTSAVLLHSLIVQ